MIPDRALRMKLTLQHTPGSSLTSFISIGKAIRSFDDFPWKIISNMLPGEMANFAAVVRQVVTALLQAPKTSP